MSIRDLKAQARGRWPDLLRQLGVDRKLLNKRNQACPACGGKDRWRFTNHEDTGQAICNQCGPMSPLDLLMTVRGWDLMTTVREVEAVLGISRYQPEVRMGRERRSALLNELWSGARTVRPNDPVSRFLERRCGVLTVPTCLRTHPSLFYKGNPDANEPDSRHPAMVAMVQAPDGTCETLHRTYLTPEGEKAPVPAPRRLMPGGYAPGSAVRLMPAGPELGVAEGIETAFSASILHAIPVWALINAHNLSQFAPPEGVLAVRVFGDADPKFAGQAAAYALAKRLASKNIAVSVHIPEVPGTDWNDVHRALSRSDSA